MLYDIDIKKENGSAKTIVAALLDKYEQLKTDKPIENTALIDLYIVDCGKRYYINKGYYRYISDDTVRIEVYNWWNIKLETLILKYVVQNRK